MVTKWKLAVAHFPVAHTRIQCLPDLLPLLSLFCEGLFARSYETSVSIYQATRRQTHRESILTITAAQIQNLTR